MDLPGTLRLEFYSVHFGTVGAVFSELYNSKESTDSKAMDAVKMIYQACMDTSRLHSMRGKEIIEAIEVQQVSYLIFQVKLNHSK